MATIVSFFQLLWINFILHPYFTWSSWIPMKSKSSSFPSSFLHGRCRLTTEIPISHHCITYFVVLRMVRSSNVCVFYKRKVPQNSGTPAFLWIFQNYSWHCFYKTPPGDCFWMLTTGKILMIAGQRYHFLAFWVFSFWIIAFSWTGPTHGMQKLYLQTFY